MATDTIDAAAQQAAKVVVEAVKTADANAAIAQAVNTNAFIINLFGYQINLVTILLIGLIVLLLSFFWRIQRSDKLDFTDMLSMDGRKVSLSKVLQLIGGLASTWFVVKQGLQGTLGEGIFGIYLTYVGGVEAFSKFMTAKYNYSETSVRDAQPSPSATEDIKASVKEAQDGAQIAVDAAKEASSKL